MSVNLFRVRIMNFETNKTEYEYFESEKEAKIWCINRSEYYLKVLDSYEDKDNPNITYQIQYYAPFDGYIPDYGITMNDSAFSV